MLSSLIKKIAAPRFAWYSTLAAFAILFFTNGVPYIQSDGFYYFHIAKSLVDQGSFVYSVEPEYHDYSGIAVVPYLGKWVEVVSPGGGLFLAPGLAAAKQLRSADQTIYSDYYLSANGHTLADGIAVLLTAMSFGLLAVLLVYKTLKTLGYSSKTATLATGSAFISSYVVWYIFLAPAFTHVYELFAFALYLWGLAHYYTKGNANYLRWVGTAIGLAFLIRPVFAVLGVVAAVILLVQGKWRETAQVFVWSSWAIVVWMVYNLISYGSLITSGYAQLRGESFTSDFNALNILLSVQRGWLVYSPLFALGILGLTLLWRKSRPIAGVSLLVIAATVVIYGFWGAWWGGGSYGSRFLIPLAVFGALGVAQLVSWSRQHSYQMARLVLLLVIFTTAWSGILSLMYRFTPVSRLRPVEDRVGGMYSADRYTPLDMIGYHVNLAKQATSLGGYLTSLYKSVDGGVSLLAIFMGASDTVLRVDERTAGEVVVHKLVPAYTSQELVGKVNGLIQLSSGQIVGFQADFARLNSIRFTCTAVLCSSPDETVQFSSAPAVPAVLSRSEWQAVELESLSARLYLRKPQNTQLKGQPLMLSVDDAGYVLK